MGITDEACTEAEKQMARWAACPHCGVSEDGRPPAHQVNGRLAALLLLDEKEDGSVAVRTTSNYPVVVATCSRCSRVTFFAARQLAKNAGP